MAPNGRIRVGVGGWTYPPWRNGFYPKGLPHARELGFAARHLSAIEVNGTFYRTQSQATFAKWRDETPDDFVFTLKAPRYATNRRVLAEAGASIDRFISSGVAELGDKLGAIAWQFAPTKAFEAKDFEAFLKLLPDTLGKRPLRHAVEVRHPSFACDAFTALARSHGVAVVRAGDSEYPEIDAPADNFAYLRLMGSVPGGYPTEALDRWATDARRLAAGGRDVFLFVISGHKVENPAAAMALIDRLG